MIAITKVQGGYIVHAGPPDVLVEWRQAKPSDADALIQDLMARGASRDAVGLALDEADPQWLATEASGERARLTVRLALLTLLDLCVLPPAFIGAVMAPQALEEFDPIWAWPLVGLLAGLLVVTVLAPVGAWTAHLSSRSRLARRLAWTPPLWLGVTVVVGVVSLLV